MKHFLFTAFTAFMFVSCSDNSSDSKSTNDNDSMEGSYALIQMSLIKEDFTPVTCEQLNTVQFTDAGPVIFVYHLGSNSNNCHTNAVETRGYTMAGDNIIIPWDESDEGLEMCHLTVTELSGSTLKCKTTIIGERVEGNFQKAVI